MEMKSMKVDPESAQESMPMAVTPPPYPYGLCLSLDDDTCDNLGITDLPAVGTEVMIQAKAIVTAAGVGSDGGGEMQKRLELQITDMGVSIGKKVNVEKVLYGGE